MAHSGACPRWALAGPPPAGRRRGSSRPDFARGRRRSAGDGATWGENLPRELIKALAGFGERTVGRVRRRRAGRLRAGLGGGPFCRRVARALPHARGAARPTSSRGRVCAKLAQRAACPGPGHPPGPLDVRSASARNAYLNIGKLGAACDGFHRDYYGRMPDSINVGDRSDRLVVHGGASTPTPAPALCRAERASPWRSIGPSGKPAPDVDVRAATEGANAVAIQVPPDHASLRAAEPELGAEWRDAVGAALEAVFREGYVVTAFDPDREGGRPPTSSPREMPRDGGAVDRTADDRAPARPSVPHELRHLDRKGLRARGAPRPTTRTGGAECVADVEPGFSEEFNEGAWLVLRDFLGPAMMRAGDVGVYDLDRVVAFVRGNLDGQGRVDRRVRRRRAARSWRLPGVGLGANRVRVPQASPSASPRAPTCCWIRSRATWRRAIGGSS